MATKTKVVLTIAVIISLLVFVLEFSGAYEFLSDKLLLKYDYIGNDRLIFLDVDDGNCALVQSDNQTALINFGGVKDGGNSLIKAIRKYRITKIDYAFITVCDQNHLGGFIALTDLVDINKVVIPNLDDFDYEHSATSLAVKDKILNDFNYEVVEINKTYKLGEINLTPFYYEPSTFDAKGRAVLYKISSTSHSAIIGGSFHKDVMYELLANNAKLETDIFLIPGFSDNASWNLPFFNSLKAKYLISSSGFKNDSVVQQDIEFLKQNYNIYRTDVNGDIMFYFKKNGLILNTER